MEIVALLAAWAAAIALIHPAGNFPLHDDWDFAIATWNFARTGHFHFTNFTAVGLRAQVLWGALWTHLFGESFNVLRASTLFLSAATILIVDRTLARAGVIRSARMLASLALLFHPLFLWASCTYMTDVPYIFASAVAFYCFVRALQEDQIAFVIAGCAAVVIAWFVRQNGVVLLGAPLALLVWDRPKRWKPFAATICAFIALYGAIALFKIDWLSGAPKMFAVHYHVWSESSFRLPEQIATLRHYVVFTLQNCGLFFLPLVAPLLALGRPRRGEAVALAIGGAVVAYSAIDLALGGYLVPYNSAHLAYDILPGNLFVNFGIGPPLLIEWYFPFPIATAARAALTIAGVILATLLIRGMHQTSIAGRLAVLTAAIGTLALFASGYYYDRYSLDAAWSLCIALPMTIPWSKRLARNSAIAALVVMAVFSTLAVQEYFRWQTARWKAFDDLRTHGVAVTQIDGGGEAFGFYELANAPVAEARRPHPPRPYAIAFRPLDGYTVVARYPFTSFCGLRRGEILTLRKITGTSG